MAFRWASQVSAGAPQRKAFRRGDVCRGTPSVGEIWDARCIDVLVASGGRPQTRRSGQLRKCSLERRFESYRMHSQTE